MPSPESDVRVVPVCWMLVLCLGVAACNHSKAHAVPPVTTPPAAPVETKAPSAAPAPPKIDTQPAPAPLPESSSPNVPRPKPKKSSSEQTSDSTSNDQPAHPAAPQISPQMSPGDQASLEKKTNEDVSAAQNNLAQAGNKPLSAAQQDLVDKIRSFLNQSREASKGGDWTRAQNLAQKARLLSVELVNSL
jgi:outer membrane biosynthesis protein TonB